MCLRNVCTRLLEQSSYYVEREEERSLNSTHVQRELSRDTKFSTNSVRSLDRGIGKISEVMVGDAMRVAGVTTIIGGTEKCGL